MHRKRSISSGIWENEVVQALSDPAFKIWVGIWSVSDRNGIFPWRPGKWALRFTPRNIKESEQLFQELLDGGLVEQFEAGGEAYGFSVNWSKHQDPHIDEAPVYPMPISPNFTPCPPRHRTAKNSKWIEVIYGPRPSVKKLEGTSAVTGAGTGRDPASPSSPSGPSGPSSPSREMDARPGLDEPALADTSGEVVIITFPCKGKGPKEYPVTQAMLVAWGEAYPGIDPLLEAKRLRVWLEQCPHKLRSASRMGTLISLWLTNAEARPQVQSTGSVQTKNSPRWSRADQEYLDDLNQNSQEENP